MNARFFDVKKSKQDSIINAALKIFSINGYKNASTDVIVKEAGISKGLLFHYFGSKQGLYEFIYDYSVKYMTLELTRTVNKSEKDFFVVQVQVSRAKTRVMKNYPYMEQFLNNSRSETDPEALAAIGDLRNVMGDTYNNIYSQTDNTRFMDRLNIVDVIDMIGWMSEGFIRDYFRKPDFNLDDMNDEFEKILNLLRRHFYRSPGDDMISIAREEMIERNDDVMEDFRLKATFEERLKAGRNAIFENEAEEEKDSQVESESDKPSAALETINNSASVNDTVSEATEGKSEAEAVATKEENTDVNASEAENAEINEAAAKDPGRGDSSIEEENSDKEAKENSDATGDESFGSAADDDIALPSWWVGSSRTQETDTVVVSASTGADIVASEEPVKEDVNDETVSSENEITENVIPENANADSETSGYEAAMPNIPVVGEASVEMPNFQVPEELLHSTLNKLSDDDDDDDDEPWTPRPVRQIRL